MVHLTLNISIFTLSVSSLNIPLKMQRLSFYWKRGRNQLYYFFIFIFIFLVYLFLEREKAGERQRERERKGERIPSRLHTTSAEPNMKLELTNHKIMTWAKTKSWTLNQLSHPGAPVEVDFWWIPLSVVTIVVHQISILFLIF